MAGFEEQVILVTGAKGGLGASVTKAFLAAGATVVGVSRSISDADFPNRKFVPVAADLLKPEGARRAVEAALETAKKVDALVHVMGGFAGGQPIWETDDAKWDQMMDMNLRAAFYITRAVLPHMLRAGQGRIIAIGSRQAVEPGALVGAYSVSKAGLLALIRTIALEVKDKGITANAVLPGTINTAANRKAMPEADTGKWVTPEAIASLVLWLASDQAEEVNGAAIPIFGKS